MRNYDPALGRWAQVDPYGQFSSPYNGMGNIPHWGVDPDGGFVFPIIPLGIIKLAAALKTSTVLATVTVTAAKVSAVATAAKVTAVAGAAYVGGTAATGGFNPMTHDIAPRHLMQGGDFYGKNFYNGDLLHHQSTQMQPRYPEMANLQSKGIPQPQQVPQNKWVLREYKPSFTQKWSQSSNILANASYEAVDALYVASHFFMPWKEPTHLNGDWATPDERATAFGASALTAMTGGIPAAKSGQTIVGEGMKRVSAAAAKNPGSTILNNMPAFSGSAHQVTSKMMYYNRRWLLDQMRSGRPIMDIGLDPTRGAPSIFYQMEQRMISNYLKRHPNAFKVIKP